MAIARKANGHLVDLRTQGSDLTTRLSIPETCRTVFTNSSHFFNRLFLLIDYGMVRRR